MNTTLFSESALDVEMDVEVNYGSAELSINHPDAPFRVYYYFKDGEQLDRLISALQKAKEMTK